METINQTECVSAFKYNNVEARLYWDGATQGGKCRMSYWISVGGSVIHQGNNLLMAPSIYPDSVEAMVVFLGFATVAPGDTDPEYFARYSPEMLAWSASPDAEYIGSVVNDFEGGETEYHPDAVTFFTDNIVIYP